MNDNIFEYATVDEYIEIMEVKPSKNGWYLVTLYKNDTQHPDGHYSKEWMFFDGKEWKYGGSEGICFVCFVHKMDTLNHNQYISGYQPHSNFSTPPGDE